MMPIICLEGPSAVGKTTLCRALSACGSYAVPEVNTLFSPSPKPCYWYLEKQVERWTLAQEKARQHPFSVLDGDVFQPLWYNWSFDFQGLESLDVLSDFYRPRLCKQKIGFPKYVVLQSDKKTLLDHKAKDKTRQRRNFEKHLSLIEPQQRYFRAFEALAPGSVRFLDVQEVESVQDILGIALQRFDHRYSVDLFDALVMWLKNQAPAQQVGL